MSTEETSQEIEIASDSRDRNCSKSFVQKLITKTKWKLHPSRNFVANSNSAQLSYLLGWKMLLVCAFVFIYFVFFPKLSIFWIGFFFLVLAAISFCLGFAIETYSFWKSKNKLLIKIFFIIGGILTPVSLYFARCIFVDITTLEPSNLSRALIVFSAIIQIPLWLCLFIIVLLLICFLGQFFVLLNFIFLQIFILVKNNPLFLFWLGKTKVVDIEKNIFSRFLAGTFIGAAAWAFVLILLLNFAQWRIEPHYLINITEEVIILADYRPYNKISECTNLEQGDWGLLAGYKKISVAHPQKSGRYTFTTKTCLFADKTLKLDSF